MRLVSLIALVWFCLGNAVFAAEISVSEAKIRATPEGAKVSAGYLKIKNNSTTDDRLISAVSPFSKMTQIHTMKMEDNVMKMRPLNDGLPVPAGEEVELKPGGEHLMFMQLTEKMKIGDKKTIILHFENSGKMEVEFEVVGRN